MSLLCPEGPSVALDSECALCSAMEKGTGTAGAVEEITLLMKGLVRANLPPSELAWVSLRDTFTLESQHVAIIRVWQAAR